MSTFCCDTARHCCQLIALQPKTRFSRIRSNISQCKMSLHEETWNRATVCKSSSHKSAIICTLCSKVGQPKLPVPVVLI